MTARSEEHVISSEQLRGSHLVVEQDERGIVRGDAVVLDLMGRLAGNPCSLLHVCFL